MGPMPFLPFKQQSKHLTDIIYINKIKTQHNMLKGNKLQVCITLSIHVT